MVPIATHRELKLSHLQADLILNINIVYFDNMVSQIYLSELQLNKTNISDTEAAFFRLAFVNF